MATSSMNESPLNKKERASVKNAPSEVIPLITGVSR